LEAWAFQEAGTLRCAGRLCLVGPLIRNLWLLLLLLLMQVVVTMEMVRKATDGSRPSVSEKERKQLQTLYARFAARLPPTEERGTRQTMS